MKSPSGAPPPEPCEHVPLLSDSSCGGRLESKPAGRFLPAHLQLLGFYEAAVVSVILSPCLQAISDKENQDIKAGDLPTLISSVGAPGSPSRHQGAPCDTGRPKMSLGAELSPAILAITGGPQPSPGVPRLTFMNSSQDLSCWHLNSSRKFSSVGSTWASCRRAELREPPAPGALGHSPGSPATAPGTGAPLPVPDPLLPSASAYRLGHPGARGCGHRSRPTGAAVAGTGLRDAWNLPRRRKEAGKCGRSGEGAPRVRGGRGSRAGSGAKDASRGAGRGGPCPEEGASGFGHNPASDLRRFPLDLISWPRRAPAPP